MSFCNALYSTSVYFTEINSVIKAKGNNNRYHFPFHKWKVEAATWVWNKQTADSLIDTVICEYHVIEHSQKFGIKPEKPSDISDCWRSYLSDIKVSYDAAKAYIKGGELFEILVKVNMFDDISDISYFLDLIKTQGADFELFIKDQKIIFKQIAAIWAHDLTDDQINDVYNRIGDGHFSEDKSSYKTMISDKIDSYRSTLGSVKLRNYWKEKTGTETPFKWSEKNLTPVLALVPQSEVGDAKKYFDIINNPNPISIDADNALTYLKSIKWWDALESQEECDKAFQKSIIGEYSTILSVEQVRDLLNRHLSDGAYYWYSNDQARNKIKELAQATYDTKSVHDALSVINSISDEKIKEYLKRLIKTNMAVGIEIISDNKGE